MKRYLSSALLLCIVCLGLFPLTGNTSEKKMKSFYLDNLYIQSYKGQLGQWTTNSVYSLAQKMGTKIEDVRKINNGNLRGNVFVPMGLIYYNQLINEGHGRRKLTVDSRQFSWPLEKVFYTSRFGPRSGTMHTGLDIACGIGTPVLAAADGVVSHSGIFGALGRAIAIYHKDGIRSWYGHNSRVLLQTGEKVKRGQIIAFSGNTGRSTGPHVHFEVRYMDVVMNPEDFLIQTYSRPNLVQLESSPVEITEETTYTSTLNNKTN